MDTRIMSYKSDYLEPGTSSAIHLRVTIKALVNEDTLLPMMFLGLRKLGNICCGHKMFLNQKHFLCPGKNLCPQQMLRAQANGETFVSATMCPQQCVLVCQGLYTGQGESILVYLCSVVPEQRKVRYSSLQP